LDLIGLAFEVTQKCNSDCAFCYNIWKEDKNYPVGQLSFEKITKLFDAVLPSVLTSSIYITGGEPLLRKDLEDIVQYFSSKKFTVAIATNGLLLSQNRAESLINAGVNQFEVTLLSANEKVHNRLSGTLDGFRKACEAIVNVKKMKQKIYVGFTATKENIQEAEDVMDLSFALCADGMSIYRFVPTGKGLHHGEKFMPSIAEINDALEILDDKSEKYKMDVFLGIPIAPNQLRRKLRRIKMTNCQAGLTKFTIDCLGNLRVCEQNPKILGNLFEENFLSLMLSKEARRFRALAKKYKGGCPLLFRKETLSGIR